MVTARLIHHIVLIVPAISEVDPTVFLMHVFALEVAMTSVPDGISEVPTYDRSVAAGINWTTSLQQAADIAARENLPLLVQVTSDNCRYCQQMKREAFTHAEVISLLNQNYVTVQVDADQERAFISQMKITSLPTTLIVAPNRQILERVEGARSAAQLLEYLHRNRSAELDEFTIVSDIR